MVMVKVQNKNDMKFGEWFGLIKSQGIFNAGSQQKSDEYRFRLEINSHFRLPRIVFVDEIIQTRFHGLENLIRKQEYILKEKVFYRK